VFPPILRPAISHGFMQLLEAAQGFLDDSSRPFAQQRR
jgi:hypothetical protein